MFLWKSLAEENLNFIEATEKLKKMKTSEDKKVRSELKDHIVKWAWKTAHKQFADLFIQ